MKIGNNLELIYIPFKMVGEVDRDLQTKICDGVRPSINNYIITGEVFDRISNYKRAVRVKIYENRK
jgi:hypothetical protein